MLVPIHNKEKAMTKRIPDDIDIAILTELRKYPPDTMRQIGVTLNRSHVTIRNRIVWLEKHQYVKQADNVPKGAARSKVLDVKGFKFLDHVSTQQAHA